MEVPHESEQPPLEGYPMLPPQVPLTRKREVLILCRRYVFSLACLATFLLLGVFFLHADALISRPPENGYVVSIQDQGNTPSFPPPSQQAALHRLFITTMPRQAAVYINGDSVGASPIWTYREAGSSPQISVEKPDYAGIDTVVMLHGASSILYLALREKEQDGPREDSPEAPVTPRVAAIDATAQILPEETERVLPGVPTRETTETSPAATASSGLEQSASPGKAGVLKVLVRPWGSIYIDEQLHKRERATWYTAQLPAGTHHLQVMHPTLGRWEQVIHIAANEEHPVVVDLNQREDTPR